jgi:hypothetical protein
MSIDGLWALWGHFVTAITFGLFPTIGIALVMGFLCLVTWNRSMILAGFVFGLFGGSIGLLLGASRDSAVAAVVPAIITLVAGLLAYLIPESKAAKVLLGGSGSDDKATLRFVVVAIATLSLSAVTGANFGASVRSVDEEYIRAVERNLLLYENVVLPIERAQIEAALELE